MLNNISFYMVLGKPLIMYMGILTFLLLTATGFVGVMVLKGKTKFSNHKILAGLTILMGIIHGVLGVLSFF